MWNASYVPHMNQMNVSPTNGNGPTQGQRKTLTIPISPQFPYSLWSSVPLYRLFPYLFIPFFPRSSVPNLPTYSLFLCTLCSYVPFHPFFPRSSMPNVAIYPLFLYTLSSYVPLYPLFLCSFIPAVPPSLCVRPDPMVAVPLILVTAAQGY